MTFVRKQKKIVGFTGLWATQHQPDMERMVNRSLNMIKWGMWEIFRIDGKYVRSGCVVALLVFYRMVVCVKLLVSMWWGISCGRTLWRRCFRCHVDMLLAF